MAATVADIFCFFERGEGLRPARESRGAREQRRATTTTRAPPPPTPPLGFFLPSAPAPNWSLLPAYAGLERGWRGVSRTPSVAAGVRGLVAVERGGGWVGEKQQLETPKTLGLFLGAGVSSGGSSRVRVVFRFGGVVVVLRRGMAKVFGGKKKAFFFFMFSFSLSLSLKSH